MADEKRDPTAAPGGKRRRPAPTIELKATEIASASAKSAEPVDPPQETPRADVPPIVPGEPEAPTAEPREPAAAASAPARGWRPEWMDVAAMTNRMAGWRDRAAERLNGRLMAAGGAGAAAMLAIVLALWIFGANPRNDLTVTLAARLGALEAQLRELAARPQPASVDPRALADLDARIARAEAAAAAPRAAPPPDQVLTGRVAALEAATRSLGELAQRVDAAQKNSALPAAQAADHKEIEALAARIAALEQTAKGFEERIARAAMTAGADRAGRLAFVAVVLRTAVERGEPFAQELAAARTLAPDAAALVPLEPFAAAGVPGAATLAREFTQLAPGMLAVTQTARDAGLVGRLQQNAERLVRIRPISEAPGDDPAGIVARAEAKATLGDIAGALTEVTRLPDTTRAGATAWIRKAQLQVAALAAARQFATAAVDALAKAAP
jgi:hypothetical protein